MNVIHRPPQISTYSLFSFSIRIGINFSFRSYWKKQPFPSNTIILNEMPRAVQIYLKFQASEFDYLLFSVEIQRRMFIFILYRNYFASMMRLLLILMIRSVESLHTSLSFACAVNIGRRQTKILSLSLCLSVDSRNSRKEKTERKKERESERECERIK